MNLCCTSCLLTLTVMRGGLLGKKGMLMQIKMRAAEAMLEGEMTEHLGHKSNEPADNASSNPLSMVAPVDCRPKFTHMMG